MRKYMHAIFENITWFEISILQFNYNQIAVLGLKPIGYKKYILLYIFIKRSEILHIVQLTFECYFVAITNLEVIREIM